MKNIKITDLQSGAVPGVEVLLPGGATPYQETYFEWTASSLIAKFKKSEISGGILQAWHHVPAFTEVETHCDNEMFYFLSGVALMLFCDVKNNQPDLKTAQIIRIQPGTQIIISAGKAHFVPVAEGTEPVLAIVVSPQMAAPRMSLLEAVEGIE
jgi:mannose-6-phosphate isomerase-like protein (cupin superfamily)